MFKQFLQHVPGADWFMIGSLAVFIIFFLGVSIYLLTADKKGFEQMASLPLTPDSKTNL